MDSIKVLREKIVEANRLYDELRTTVRIPEDQPYQKEGISILSEPFLKGVFTLAVIGEMSAGKSAFINALLEDQDLLPTGHFQTTCTLTEILWSENKKLIVTYGDAHKVVYNGDEILGKLKDVAAIDPKYDAIPINHVNQYILQGLSKEEIVKKRDEFKAISSRTIDPELLEEYINGKNSANIPVNVYMEYPLSDSFKGWRIVDTPGIGAKGGIDKTTKDFLANENVDSAIFVFNGCEHIEKEAGYTMVNNSYAELTDVAKERTFFVITHAGKKDCKDNLKRTMSIALDYFSKGDICIPESRFFAVDSMLSLLNDIAIEKAGVDPCIFLQRGIQIDGLSKEEISMYREMLNILADEVEGNGKEVNTENLHECIIRVAGFVKLKKTLGDFAREAKKDAYNRVISTIMEDFKSFGSSKFEEKTLRESKLTKSPEEFEQELERKKNEIKQYRNTLNEKFNEILYDYTDEELVSKFTRSVGKFEQKLKKANYSYEMKIAHENFLEWFPLEEEIVVTNFTSKCRDLQVDVAMSFPSISVPPVDFEKAKREAIRKSTKEETYTVKVKKSGIFNTIKSWFGAKSAYRDEERTRTFVDEAQQLIEEKNELLKQVRDSLRSYCKKFKSDFINPTANNINQQLRRLVEVKEDEYNAIKTASLNAEEQQKMIDLIKKELNIIEDTKIKVSKFEIKN